MITYCFRLALIISFAILSYSSSANEVEEVNFENCSSKNFCYKGNRYIAWITNSRLLGDKLIVNMTFQSKSNSGINVKFENNKAGAEIIDSAGNLYLVDKTRLVDVHSSFNRPSDLRLFFAVDEKFAPPFDVSVRSSDNGNADIINIAVK